MPDTPSRTSRHAVHALVIGDAEVVDSLRQPLAELGFETDAQIDPYQAMIEICRRPLVYRALVLSLQHLYPHELEMITTVRRRFPHMSVWLTRVEGRQAAAGKAIRRGAEGLLDATGLSSFDERETAAPPSPGRVNQYRPLPQLATAGDGAPTHDRSSQAANAAEPVLTADELRALLGER